MKPRGPMDALPSRRVRTRSTEGMILKGPPGGERSAMLIRHRNGASETETAVAAVVGADADADTVEAPVVERSAAISRVTPRPFAQRWTSCWARGRKRLWRRPCIVSAEDLQQLSISAARLHPQCTGLLQFKFMSRGFFSSFTDTPSLCNGLSTRAAARYRGLAGRTCPSGLPCWWSALRAQASLAYLLFCVGVWVGMGSALRPQEAHMFIDLYFSLYWL